MGKFYEGAYEALSVYVRQSAWLSAVPVKEKKQKLAVEEKPVSRIERMRADGIEPDFPPLICAEHLLGYLWEVGPVMAGGMAPSVVSQSEIHAWQFNSGVELTAWESRTLRRLSHDYLSQIHLSEKPECPAPWTAEKPDRDAVERKVKSAMRAFMKRED